MGTTTPRWGFYKPDSMEDGWADEGHAWIDALDARARTTSDTLAVSRFYPTADALKDDTGANIELSNNVYYALPWVTHASDATGSVLYDPSNLRNQNVESAHNDWATETAGKQYRTFTLPPGVWAIAGAVGFERMPVGTAYGYMYCDYVDYTTPKGVMPDDIFTYLDSGTPPTLWSARPATNSAWLSLFQLLIPTVATEYVLGMYMKDFGGVGTLKIRTAYLTVTRIH